MSKHTITWVAIFVVITLMFLRLPRMVAKQEAVVRTYSALVEVDALARQKFVEPVESGRLVHGAIRGMMFQLDAYSGYITPEQLPAFERRSQGDYVGIGVELGMRHGQLTVVAPLEGGPAAESGIMAGDLVVAIDDQEVEGLSVFDVEKLLDGPLGGVIRLRVSHSGDTEPQTLTITRRPVSLVTVRGFGRDERGTWEYLIDPSYRIGYIRISNFLNNTLRTFDEVLNDLLDWRIRGLVLDLRFNPGGLMHQAVALVDRFVDEGIILSTVTRRRAVREYRAAPRGTIDDLPLVVLINAGSASAAEIVAGALQDHRRAVIVGERSFGKGSVQHVIPLSEHKAAICLTTAYYRLPLGRVIHRTPENSNDDLWGVTPDVIVILDQSEVRAIQASRRTLDLHASLNADRVDGRTASAAESGVREPGHPKSVKREGLRDRQLDKALSLMRDTITAAHQSGK